MSSYRNPAHLLGIDRDPELTRMLRACGVEEAYITGGAPDYLKFCAWAEVFPLCAGHGVAERVLRTLQEATGAQVSLCPHTAREIWKIWTDIYWYGMETPHQGGSLACSCCGACEPIYVEKERLVYLLPPETVKAENFGAWTKKMTDALPDSRAYSACILPDDYSFTRPDPYHVGEALRGIAGGAVPTRGERDLLWTQALRTWGQELLKRDTDGRFFLIGGPVGEVTVLLDYLHRSKALTRMVWIPRNPEEAGEICGRYACVETGMDLTACATSEERKTHITAYATVAPLGRAVALGSP